MPVCCDIVPGVYLVELLQTFDMPAQTQLVLVQSGASHYAILINVHHP